MRDGPRFALGHILDMEKCFVRAGFIYGLVGGFPLLHFLLLAAVFMLGFALGCT